MKLYLSSYSLGDEPQRFADLFGVNKKVAIIMNAADVFGSAERPEYLRREIAKLAEIDLIGEELDLRDYFHKQDALADALAQYGGVWIMGGNSFVLRRAMRQSGFDRTAPLLVKDGQLVYGGFSAGSVAASPTLQGIELVDNPTDVPVGYNSPIIWEGLGLYEYAIAPHYQSDHPESADIDKVVAYFKANHVPYKALHDGKVIVVDSTKS
jgi:dipeptidase E